MLDSGLIPAVELTDIFRQARESDIVLNAHAINRGEMPKISGKTGDYFFIPGGDNINDLCKLAGWLKDCLRRTE